MSKKIFCLAVLLLCSTTILGCGATDTYDSSIHDGNISEIFNDFNNTNYIQKKEYEIDKYEVYVWKSDERKESWYAEGKLFEYIVFIKVNEEFLKLTRTQKFDFINKIALVFGESLADNDGKYRGIYSKIILTYKSHGDPDYDSWSMNVQGIRIINGKT